MTLFGSYVIGFIFALGITTFFMEKWLIKMDKKDLAMYLGIIAFAIASIAGLAQYNSGLEAIKDFIHSAMF